MLIVALASLAVAGITVLAAFAALRWQNRAHDRKEQTWAVERARLVDQVCNLADKPWTLPPAREPKAKAESDESREAVVW